MELNLTLNLTLNLGGSIFYAKRCRGGTEVLRSLVIRKKRDSLEKALEAKEKRVRRRKKRRERRERMERRESRESDHGGLHHHLSITEQCP